MRQGTEVKGSTVHIVQLPLEWRDEVRLMSWISSLEQTLAWYEGKLLTGWSATRTHNGWRLIVKATSSRGNEPPQHHVAFYHHETLMGCFLGLARGVKQSQIGWTKDRYPPDIGD